jgi:hypothetical protein
MLSVMQVRQEMNFQFQSRMKTVMLVEFQIQMEGTGHLTSVKSKGI